MTYHCELWIYQEVRLDWAALEFSQPRRRDRRVKFLQILYDYDSKRHPDLRRCDADTRSFGESRVQLVDQLA